MSEHLHIPLGTAKNKENKWQKLFLLHSAMKEAQLLKLLPASSKCTISSIWIPPPQTTQLISTMCDRPAARLDKKNLEKNTAEIYRKTQNIIKCDSEIFKKKISIVYHLPR